MFDVLNFDLDGHLATITLNRPKAMNALNPPLVEAMSDAFKIVRDTPSIWVAILTSTGGRAFSAGNDLKWRTENADSIRDFEETREDAFNHPKFGLWKPVIAAVDGYAVGGGLELAMACDVVIASDRSRFGLPEAKRGLMADGGGVQGLARAIPTKLAMEMILTGSFISADRAQEFGIVNTVVSSDELMKSAIAMADEMLECSPKALQAAKQAAILGRDEPYWDVLDTEYSMFERLKASNDFTEGPKAFSEKRIPEWEDA
ncbi:MAG: enoyl-CoA hydratase-related protein [Dehalococcoidia bacterium]|nr:enoyl-CoA hydratase-related protein [Dehalococcoidia bacterium]